MVAYQAKNVNMTLPQTIILDFNFSPAKASAAAPATPINNTTAAAIFPDASNESNQMGLANTMPRAGITSGKNNQSEEEFLSQCSR